MKILFIVAILSVFLISPVFGEDEWDTIDKSLLYPLITFKIIDCFQTIEIFENDKYYEQHNLFIVKGVERFGKKFIPLYFGTEITAIYIFSNDLSSPYRKSALSLLLGSSLFMISHNASIGIGFALPF